MNKLLIVYTFFIMFFTASPAYSLLCYQGSVNCSDITHSSIDVFDCDHTLPANVPKHCAKVKLSASGNVFIGWGCIPDGIPCEDYLKRYIEPKTNQILIMTCETCSSDRCNYRNGINSDNSDFSNRPGNAMNISIVEECNSSFGIRPSLATIVSMGILSAFFKTLQLCYSI